MIGSQLAKGSSVGFIVGLSVVGLTEGLPDNTVGPGDVGTAVGDVVGLAVGLSVAGLVEGLADTTVGPTDVGTIVDDMIGVAVGLGVGNLVGGKVGPAVGAAAGTIIGVAIGLGVGNLVGGKVGPAVGAAVGKIIGVAIGLGVGNLVGGNVGLVEGAVVGDLVVGVAVGSAVGSAVVANTGEIPGEIESVSTGLAVGSGAPVEGADNVGLSKLEGGGVRVGATATVGTSGTGVTKDPLCAAVVGEAMTGEVGIRVVGPIEIADSIVGAVEISVAVVAGALLVGAGGTGKATEGDTVTSCGRKSSPPGAVIMVGLEMGVVDVEGGGVEPSDACGSYVTTPLFSCMCCADPNTKDTGFLSAGKSALISSTSNSQKS